MGGEPGKKNPYLITSGSFVTSDIFFNFTIFQIFLICKIEILIILISKNGCIY